jgi:predicted RND superfamily exporter protein
MIVASGDPLGPKNSWFSGLRRIATRQPAATDQLAFGIERIGFLSLRAPMLVAIAALLLVGLASMGLSTGRVDDSLSQLFRSDTPEFQQYEEEVRRFPSSEYDVLVVVEGEQLLQRNSIEALRNLATNLQLIDGARGAISIFSAREAPQQGHLPGPLFLDALPSGDAYQQLIGRVKSSEIIRGKLLSEDGKLTLMIVALDPKLAQSNGLSRAVDAIRKAANDDLAGTGLEARLTGVPVMQLETRTAIERDRLVYNAAGFAAGCLIAIAFFRRLSFMIMAAAPPLTAILLSLGAFGWLDLRLNIFLNVMTPLIMVISFSDSMQLTFAVRDRLMAGDGKREALRQSILVVGPARVLTHATVALSFLALQFSQSDLIRTLGKAGLLATAIALVTVLMLSPLLGLLVLRNDRRLAGGADEAADLGVGMLRRFCRFVAVRMVNRPLFYALVGVVLLAGLGFGYAQLHPDEEDLERQRFHYESHNELRSHLADFVSAYNFAKRLKALKGLTPYEYICKIWTKEPERFTLNPLQQMPGLNI